MLVRIERFAGADLDMTLPAFVFVALSGSIVPRIRKSPIAGAVLDGVNAGSLALMAVVTWQLARTAVVDVPTALLAAAGAVGIFVFRLSSVWLIAAAALAGMLAYAFVG